MKGMNVNESTADYLYECVWGCVCVCLCCVQVLELRSGLCLMATASLCPWLSASCLSYHQSAPHKVKVHTNASVFM